jgi:hypothetical protein
VLALNACRVSRSSNEDEADAEDDGVTGGVRSHGASPRLGLCSTHAARDLRVELAGRARLLPRHPLPLHFRFVAAAAVVRRFRWTPCRAWDPNSCPLLLVFPFLRFFDVRRLVVPLGLFLPPPAWSLALVVAVSSQRSGTRGSVHHR